MRTILAMFFYLAAAAAIMLGAVGVATWLVAPDSSLARQAPARRDIPRRIADGIERHTTPFPQPPKDVSVMRPVSQTFMKEAAVALPLPTRRIKARDQVRPKQKERRRSKPTFAAADEPVSPAPQPLPTARTDFPY